MTALTVGAANAISLRSGGRGLRLVLARLALGGPTASQTLLPCRAGDRSGLGGVLVRDEAGDLLGPVEITRHLDNDKAAAVYAIEFSGLRAEAT